MRQEYVVFTYYRNVVLSLATYYARTATDTAVKVDRHTPLNAFVLVVGIQRTVLTEAFLHFVIYRTNIVSTTMSTFVFCFFTFLYPRQFRIVRYFFRTLLTQLLRIFAEFSKCEFMDHRTSFVAAVRLRLRYVVF